MTMAVAMAERMGRTIHVRCDCGAVVEIVHRGPSPLRDVLMFLPYHYADDPAYSSFGACIRSDEGWMDEPEVTGDPQTGEIA